MQAVILAGGLATRLRPLTENLPKAMVPVRGKPFLEYQLALLRNSNIQDIVLCVGHLGEMIESHFGDGSRFEVRLSYSWEEGTLLGTGGALRNAAPLLKEQFLVLYGDSYLILNYQDLAETFRSSCAPGMMVVYRNGDQYDRSNVVIVGNKVAFYSKKERRPDMVFIDAGLSAFQKGALGLLPEDGEVAMDVLFQELIARDALHAYETKQRFYEIGSFAGLQEFQALSILQQ